MSGTRPRHRRERLRRPCRSSGSPTSGYEVHGVARTPADDVEVDTWHTANLLDHTAVDGLVRNAGASYLLHLAWTTEHGRLWTDLANLAWAKG